MDLGNLKKDKYDILVLWNDATMAEDKQVSQEHIPERLTSYVGKLKCDMQRRQ